MIKINDIGKEFNVRNHDLTKNNNNDYFEFSDKSFFNSSKIHKKRLSNINMKNILFIPLTYQKDEEIIPEDREKISIVT